MPSLADLIQQGAAARGVDPAAVLSIASVEGGVNGGQIGDNGTSFGPFQLHMGGALPSQFNGNPQAANQWANSAAGINYALDAIAKVAKGLHGQQAIQAISSQFERPADVAGEVTKASGRYGQFSSGQIPPSPTFQTQPYTPGTAPAFTPQPSTPQAVAQSPVVQFAHQLLAQAAQTGQHPLSQMAQQAGGARNLQGITPLQPIQPQQNQFFQQMVDLAAQRRQSALAQQAYGQTPTTGPVTDFSTTTKSGIPVQGGGPTNQLQANIVKTAQSQLGNSYQYGGTAQLGGHTDCSGLAQAVLGANGIQIPRTTYQQWAAGKPVDAKDLQPGDLVFFNMTNQGPEHVGIYAGGGKFIEDPHTGASVRYADLSTYPGFVGARRFTS